MGISYGMSLGYGQPFDGICRPMAFLPLPACFLEREWSMETFSILVGIFGLKTKVVPFYKWLKLLLFYFFN
jgi:hypothetical protein